MKKLVSYLITAMMVFTMVPSIAFAGTAEQQTADDPAVHSELDNLQYEGSMNLHIEQTNPLYGGYSAPVIETSDAAAINEDENVIAPNGSAGAKYAATVDEAAEFLRAQMVERQASVTINMPVTEADLTNEAMTALTSKIFTSAMKHTGKVNEGDSLQWVWQDQYTDITVTGDASGLIATITYTIIYYTTAEQEAALSEAVAALKAELNLDGKSDYEKVKAIYDYMTANISYDYEHYGSESYKLQFTAFAALINKTSVCQGYATLFYRMMCEYGIDARVVAGTSINVNGEPEGHSWNIVKFGDKYYNLDATWDSTWDEDKSKHDFFLRGTAAFENHTRNAEFTTDEFNASYPMSDTDYVPGTADDEGGIESEEPETPAECTHATTEVIPAVAATCSATGLTEGLKCTSCGEVLVPQEVVAVKDHAYDDGIVTTEPTTTTEGVKTYTCTVCGDTKTESIPVIEDDGGAADVSDYSYEINEDNTVTITKYKGSKENVIIPAIIDGYKVYEVADNTFNNNDTIETVVVSEGISRIGWYIFEGCDKLARIELPKSITYIGDYAFENCKALKEIKLDSNNERYAIYGGALYTKDLTSLFACPNIESITIPEATMTVHDRAFVYCTNLKEIAISENNKNLIAKDGVVYSGDGTTLIQAAGGITEVNVLETVEKINDSAFFGNTSIISIVLPHGLEEIESFAFRECSNLKNINIPSTVSKMGEGIFYKCESIEEITMPEIITEIPAWTFWGCYGLKNVTISSKTVSIKDVAFDNCVSLKNINLPSTLKTIGQSAFSECNSLVDVVIPEGVELIGDAAFQYCDGLKSITIPASVTTIGSAAIGETWNLTTIIVDENNPNYKSENNVLYSKDGTVLIRCSVDKEQFTIPETVKRIDRAAFSECTKLDSLYIPENVEEIGFACFNHNFMMRYVTVANRKAVFGEGVFNECYWISLCGYSGSTSDKYAELTGIPFIDIENHEHAYYKEVKEASCYEDGYIREICEICFDKVETLIKGGHSYGDTWKTDASNHWKECACGAKSEETAHDYEWIIDMQPTEDTEGSKHQECTVCSAKGKTESIGKLGHTHTMVKKEAVAAECETDGNIEYYTCSECGKLYTDSEGKHEITKEDTVVAAIGHSWDEKWTVTTPATLTDAGEETKYCANCNETQTQEFAKVKSISRTYAKLIYNGAKRTPVVVKDVNGKVLKAGTDYKVQYLTNCKNVGVHKFKVVLMGKYEGSKTISFTINPKTTVLNKLTKPGKGQIKVTWQKRIAQVTGYEIQYSTTANFTKKTTETVKVKNFKTNVKTIKKLKSKKNYWVKIRIYKTVNGKPYYSSWSKAKKITTK